MTPRFVWGWRRPFLASRYTRRSGASLSEPILTLAGTSSSRRADRSFRPRLIQQLPFRVWIQGDRDPSNGATEAVSPIRDFPYQCYLFDTWTRTSDLGSRAFPR